MKPKILILSLIAFIFQSWKYEYIKYENKVFVKLFIFSWLKINAIKDKMRIFGFIFICLYNHTFTWPRNTLIFYNWTEQVKYYQVP